MQLTSGMERLARFFPIIARGGFREPALYCTVLECVQYIYDLRPVSPFWRNYTGVLSHLDSVRFQMLLVSIRSQDKYLSCNLPPLHAFRQVLSMFISEWVSQSGQDVSYKADDRFVLKMFPTFGSKSLNATTTTGHKSRVGLPCPQEPH